MSCYYPCHICDPDEWAEGSKPPPYDFDGAYDKANLALGRALHPLFDKADALMWWVPMEGQLQEVTIAEYREYEEFFLGGSRSPYTQLAANRTYLERERPGWGRGVDSFPIISYMQKVIDWEKPVAYISAVQSRTPPPWGWWMPTLNP